MLSLVIPTHNRRILLLRLLRELGEQSLRPDLFEVIVSDDGSTDGTAEAAECLIAAGLPYRACLYRQTCGGPARARNLGAQHATGDAIVFCGDDCLPDRHLLWRHYHAHRRDDLNPKAVQGLTLWHPDLPPDDFMVYLVDDGGQQANWRSLRTADGAWRDDAPGWFLTTNVSVSRLAFEQEGGFDEHFPHAAWEDIEFSIRLAKRGLPTRFCPDAINYHYHRYGLDGFVRRQLIEGENRLHLVAAHPEMAWGLLDPEGLRQSSADLLAQHLALARELHHDGAPDVQQARRQRWGATLRLASLEGIRRGIAARGGAWQAIPHIHTEELAHHVAGAAAGIERDDPHWAHYHAEWAVRAHADNWAVRAMQGESLLALGQRDEARFAFAQAVTLGPGEKWPLGRLKELSTP